jgi:uncharacterized protein
MIDNNPFLKIKTRTIFYWAVSGIVIIFLFAFLVGLIVGFFRLNFNFTIFNNLDQTASLIISSFFVYGFMGLWCWQQQSRFNLNVSALIGRLPRLGKWLPLLILNIPILLFSLGTGKLIYYFLYLYQPLMLERLITSETNTTLDRSIDYKIVLIIVVVIIAPIFEEIFFRGFIFQRMAVKWNNGQAAIISSLIFGLLHFNPIGLFVFSLVLTLAYLKTRCLLVPIFMHMVNNLIAILPYVIWFNSSSLEAATNPATFSNAWQSGLIWSGIALPLLAIFVVKNWAKKQQPIPYISNYLNLWNNY